MVTNRNKYIAFPAVYQCSCKQFIHKNIENEMMEKEENIDDV